MTIRTTRDMRPPRNFRGENAMTSARLIPCLILLVLAVSACAGPRAFGRTYPDNRLDQVSAVLARVQANPRPEQRPVVVGATARPREVFAYDLAANKLMWKRPASITTVPIAAGNFVITPEASSITIRDLETGNVRFEVPTDGMGLIGADGDDHVTAIVLSTGGSMGARSKLIIVSDGNLALSESVEEPLGGPAVLGGLVFLPWNRIYLSVLETSGQEIARVRVRDDVASQAFVRDNSVFFGSAGIFRFDDKVTAGGSAGATYYRHKRDDKLPANPGFLASSSERPPAAESAVNRVSLAWSPATNGERLMLADDNLYLAFYRQIYALEPSGLGVRWVHQTANDSVGIKALPNTVLVVDEAGALTVLDGQGRVRAASNLGVKPIAARFRVDRLEAGAGSLEDLPPLGMQLVDAALNPDTRLVPVRAMAVTMLAALEDDSATTALIEICQDRATPERVRQVACVALSKRTNGSEAVIAALGRHANYLTETKAPPVGPLAEAALKTGDPRAVPHLVAHLKDPETPVEELASLLLALKSLANASDAQPIADFLRLYHADADDERMQDALMVAMQALVKLQGARAAAVLEPVANDALGEAAIRAEAARLLATLAPAEPDAAATPPAPGGAKTPAPAAAKEPPPVKEAPPERLTHEHIKKALKSVEEKLGLCIRNDPKRPLTARLTLVIDGHSGDVLAVQTLPESVKACVEPLILSVPFPATKYSRRETITYTLTR